MSEKERLEKLKEKTIEELENLEDKIDKIYIEYDIQRGDHASGEVGETLKQLKKEFTIRAHKIKKVNRQLRRFSNE